ncbi:MAG: hypothetical protein LBV75_02475 [Paludibacter sp.]|jgi:hypothetical protein|nr:hypothetical protein [Paludibacter sp.]
MKTKSLFLGLLLCVSSVLFGQKNSFELELGAGFSMENNFGNYGIIGSTGMNYYFADRIGINTNIGFFQSFIPYKYHNCSLFKWDADVFFDVVRTQNDNRLRLSAGVSYYRGATEMVSGGRIDDNGNYIEILGYNVDFYSGIGANGKIQYRFPIAKKWYLGINGEVYYLPKYSTGGIMPVLGCSLGYKF